MKKEMFNSWHNKRFLVFIIITSLLYSCSKQTIGDIKYNGEKNYDCFYIVDTIKIKDPVRIHSLKFGGQFIVSKLLLKEYNGRREFFYRPDVFILGNDLYHDLPKEKYSNYHYPDDGGCEMVKSPLSFSGLELYEFKQDSVKFLLGLINSNYYYTKHNSYESFAFKDKNRKFTFSKIVYSVCK